MHRKHNTGFTLIELMVTIAVLAIFVGIALPAFNALIEGNRVRSAADEFHALLVAARNDAVTRRTAISVTLSGSTWSTDDRQVNIPDSVEVTPSETTITFNANGTATPSTTTFEDSGSRTSYTIETKQPGFVRKTQG